MIGPVLFALAVAAAAIALGMVAARRRHWLEASICAGGTLIVAALAFLATLPDIPLLPVLLTAWPVLGLACAAAYSLVRAEEKRRTGQDTR